MSSLAEKTSEVLTELKLFIDKDEKFETLTYKQASDPELVHATYSRVLMYNTRLHQLIVKASSFCGDIELKIASLSENTSLELNQKAQLKKSLELIKIAAKPLYTMVDMMDRLLRYYERIYKGIFDYIRPQ